MMLCVTVVLFSPESIHVFVPFICATESLVYGKNGFIKNNCFILISVLIYNICFLLG